MKPKFKLLSIALDEDNVWYVQYIGDVSGQDEIYFGHGEIGFFSIEAVTNFIKDTLNKNEQIYKTEIVEQTKKMKY